MKARQLSLVNQESLARPPKSKGRLEQLISFDAELRRLHRSDLLIGTDEVGRGCLAGPVYAGAAIMPNSPLSEKLITGLHLLNDSKQLSALARAKLAPILEEHTQWSIAFASVEEIDRYNIYHASLLAMQRAIESLIAKCNLAPRRPLVIVDGKALVPSISCKQICIIKGDGKSASIAAASILAKVHRDLFMTRLASECPDYDWHQNKGYGSPRHIKAIRTHGLTIWHRRSFTSNQERFG